MLTLISVASKIAVVFGYCSLNTDGIVLFDSGLIWPKIGDDPSCIYKKFIYEINILDTGKGDIRNLSAKSFCLRPSLSLTSESEPGSAAWRDSATVGPGQPGTLSQVNELFLSPG